MAEITVLNGGLGIVQPFGFLTNTRTEEIPNVLSNSVTFISTLTRYD